MTDADRSVVWDASFLPFGEEDSLIGSAANDNRFPGQRLEAETGLHYNYFRDYDPTTGRYLQSDPIGLAGGINTYGYVSGNPVNYTDPRGLKTYQCRRPLNGLGGSGTRSGPDVRGNPLYHQYSCVIDRNGKITCGGQDRSGSPLRSPGKPSDDSYEPKQCEKTQDDNQCFEKCVTDEWAKPRPRYGIPFGTDCQEYDDNIHKKCRKQCDL
ncbi:RHS repeat-associated core domain-containing protein [Sneathiella sp.]|uniref:RHS repeat-associated core domain-containing protein n=1 Tax=Sneathiella sp. TaxID=1964365 RepID=UPI0035656234